VKRVHCLGSMVVDALSGPLDGYPIPKQRTQVNTESVRFMPGGGAANTGSALAQLGIPVSIFSKVGRDPNGEFLISAMQKLGAETKSIKVADGEQTPFTFVGIHRDGDRTFIHTPGTNRTLSPADIDTKNLYEGSILLYQDTWVQPQLDGAPGAAILKEARKRGLVTLLDECWGLGPNREVWETMIPHADYVLPSIDDMLAIYPGQTPEGLAQTLHAKGAKHVVLKMGAKGCLLSRAAGAKPLVLPTVATQIVDTTGAGDCFDAGFIAGLFNGLEMEQAARFGALAAAACIRNVGGAVGIPKFETLKNSL